VDYATRAAQIRADFADVTAKQKIREQKEREKSSWRFEGRRRMATLKRTLSSNKILKLNS
jgi:hypothetical protein